MAAMLRSCFIPRSSLPPELRLAAQSSLSQKRGLGSSLYLAPLTSFQGRFRVAKFGFEAAPPQAVGGGGVCALAAVSVGSSGNGGALPLFISWYLNSLNKYPVPMKSVTSAFLTLIGDVICQLVIDRVPEWDVKRTFVFTFLGLVLVGPTLHFWYLYLSKLVTLQGASGAFLRLLLDQFIFSPVFLGVFLSSLLTLEGRPSQLLPKLQQEWFSSVVANWKLWIPFQFLNFWFVPQQFQVLGANVVALVWNVILSFIAHKEVKPSSANE